MNKRNVFPLNIKEIYSFFQKDVSSIIDILLDVKVPGYDVYLGIDNKKFMYVFFFKGDKLPILNAHIDNVWEDLLPIKIDKNKNDLLHNEFYEEYYIKKYYESLQKDLVLENNYIYMKNGYTGFGADDKAGVYGLLYLLTNYPNMRVNYLFTNFEEIGSIGAMKFVNDFVDTINPTCFISLDRRGNKEVVYYNNDYYNKTFAYSIESCGFVKNKGIYGDVQILGLNFKVCSANISIGYLKEHSSKEIFIYDYFLNTMRSINMLINNLLKYSNNKPYKLPADSVIPTSNYVYMNVPYTIQK